VVLEAGLAAETVLFEAQIEESESRIGFAV
jgi:hypothetical protein